MIKRHDFRKDSDKVILDKARGSGYVKEEFKIRLVSRYLTCDGDSKEGRDVIA
ncbi:MAG: hypothetical protein HY592_06185 [Candidatus Omnitrophica bacterium]|nr:hypothetical protein [Candidatus Omnitrophota bacterium]